MPRMKRGDIIYCEDCPSFNWDTCLCNRTNQTVPDGVAIPNWCPLPDAGGETQ